MDLMRLVSLRLRLMGGFVVVCALLIVLTGLGIRNAAEQERLAARTHSLLVLTGDMGRVRWRVADVSGWQLAYAWEASWMGGPEAVRASSPSRRAFEDSMAALDRAIEAVVRGPVSEPESRSISEVRALIKRFAEIDQQVVELFRRGTPEGFRAANGLVLGASYQTARAIQRVVEGVIVSVSKRSAHAQRRAEASGASWRLVQLVGAGLALLLASIISFLIARSILVSARRVIEGLERLVEHGTPPRLSDTGRDEFADIARALNRTAGLLEAARAEQHDLTERLRELAYHDPLTGLLNRSEFFERVEHAVAGQRDSNRYVAVILMDLDEFKPINDQYGHAAGDAVLQEVANRLRRQVSGAEAVARLGGDEFAILIDGEGPEELVDSLIDRIDAAVRAPIKIDDCHVVVMASLGAGIARPQEVSAKDLVEAADRAMYDRKRYRRREERPERRDLGNS